MATVITSIGSKGTTGNPVNGQLTMSSSSGSGTPWAGDVVFTSTPTANVGDKLYYHQAYYNCTGGPGTCTGPADIIYLITGVSGSTLTVKYISGGANVDPIQLKATDNGGGSAAQPYVLRYYSTIATWESDSDETALYSNGDTAQGECYADSALSVTSQIYFNGGNVTDIAKQVLTVPVGQRHDGTADSGFKVNVAPSDGDPSFKLYYHTSTPVKRTIEWIEIDGGDTDQSWGRNWAVIEMNTGGLQTYAGTVSHTLIHGCHSTRTGGGNSYGFIGGIPAYSYIHNNIVYDCSGKRRTPGIGIGSGVVTNNTVYKIGITYHSTGGTGSNEAIGIKVGSSVSTNKNNIAIGTYVEDPSSDGEKYDFFADGTGTVGTYNISGDSTASGSDSFTSITAASIFISTTTGSEDLHILRSSKAVGAGDDLGTGVSYNAGHGNDTAAGGSDYGTPLNRDINHGDRNGFAMAWDIGASQQAIISSIKSGGSGDYSTVAEWEADLDEGTYYGAGSIARGEMYPDSTFSTNFGQVGGGSTIGLVCKVLTAAEDHRHDGTESGSHVKVTQTSQITHAGAPLIMSWLDISGSGGDNRFIDGFHFAVTHCIIHDVTMGGSGGGWPGSRCVTTGIICNNIIYNIDSTTTSSWGTGYYTYLYGIWQNGTHFLCDNNTVYKVHSTNSWGGGQFAKGIVKDGSSTTAGSSLRNNIVVGTATDTEGTNGANAKDFNDSPTATFTHNLSGDSSADGSNSITGESAADLFVSNSGGSEDLHLKAGAAAIGAGADLGTTYSTTAGDATIDAGWDMGPQFDINNRDRDAEGDTWDIGAHQFVAAATTNTAFMFFVD